MKNVVTFNTTVSASDVVSTNNTVLTAAEALLSANLVELAIPSKEVKSTVVNSKSTKELVEKYSQANIRKAGAELKARVKYVIEEAYSFEFIKLELEQSLETSISKSLEIRKTIPDEYSDYISQDAIQVPDEAWAKSVKDLPKEVKASAYKYRNFHIRILMLNSILQGKVKVKNLLRHTLVKVLTEIVRNKPSNKNREWVQLSKVISGLNIKADIITRGGKVLQKGDQWLQAQMALQFISELCELDYLDGDIVGRTHSVKLPDEVTGKLTDEAKERLVELASMASRKTIFTTAPEVMENQLITTSSWYYKTPDLSQTQVDFVGLQQSIMYEFVDNAEELAEAALCDHLKEKALPKWAEPMLASFKEQIRASHANGGHYVAGQFDSALRYYMSGAFGHLQSSSALRALVKVKAIPNKIKYDFRNNVVQMYALGTGIRDLAKYVGLVPSEEELEDVRLQLAERMNDELGVTKFTKETTKPLFMIWAYNAGKARLMEGVIEVETDFFGIETVKQKVDGLLVLAEHQGEDKIWNAWNKALNELVPSIVAIKQMYRLLTKYNPLTTTSWRLPDGAIAQYASVATGEQTLKWVTSEGREKEHTHYIKEIVEGVKNTGLLPRAIHSIDAYIARILVLRASEEGIIMVPNHDSFTFDERYEDRVMEICKELLIEVMEGNVFANITNQLNNLVSHYK